MSGQHLVLLRMFSSVAWLLFWGLGAHILCDRERVLRGVRPHLLSPTSRVHADAASLCSPSDRQSLVAARILAV
ncbi:hypothetical protein CALCODRAFT_493469 [Calocera cornea HHB12733]|uniref:Uncharacterized protein n=1 Tax=Calocera cornea HHB12733 TaxID=1353952 RepID=A0A165HP07_9BASI|nr:hypothetical protein CALCODRAFT_493469 [Calocera cornea HHB12733]